MSTNQLPGVAKKVFYPCKKCETERYQVVLAHISSKSARLECEVCRTKNTFTLDEPKSARRSAVPKRSAGAKMAAHLSRWQELRKNQSSQPTPYNMKALFETGACVQHPKFGLGFVIASNGQAIQVVFEDAERSLVHNRQ